MGCFNLITKEDLEQMHDALSSGSKSPPESLPFITAAIAEKIAPIASLIFSKELSRETKSSIIPALSKIFSVTSNPIGIINSAPSYYGPRATSLVQNLAQKRNPEAYAYEILGPAALVQKQAVEITGGPPLQIQKGDRLDFGIKHQARYYVNDILLTGQPSKRSTVESDLHITRGSERVGIDFKHSKIGSYNPNIGELNEQLQGVVTALRTGEVTRFCFVTNGKFTKSFKDAVNEANMNINKKDTLGIDISEQEKEYLTNEEKEEAKARNENRILMYENVQFKYP